MATLTLGIDPAASRLVKTTAFALGRAGLDVEAVRRRLFSSNRLVDIVETGRPGESTIRLRPFAELTLRAVLDVAQSTADASTKSARIDQALSLGGY